MANILQTIVENRRNEIAELKAQKPLDSFIKQLKPSEKSLFDALAAPNAGYILECKKASPSKGLIREHFDLDEIIQAYAPEAAAFSVLTDSYYFQGSFDYLQYVTSKVTQPVLNKDFLFEPYQVYLARHYNADAILLMLSVLDDETYTELAAIAQELKLDVLTEVSNEQEVTRAIALDAKIIGINNRNLRDLSTDLATTEKLVPMIPKDRLIISESGIYTHQDVQRLAPLVNGFLVGSSLMSQQDLPLAVKQLVYGKVKVCGLTQQADIQAAKELGASYGGLIFAEKSPRKVHLEQAQVLVSQQPFNYVGVFVNQELDEVVHIANELQLSAVQLHGNEDQAYIDTLKQKLRQECQIWRAKGVEQQLPELNEQRVDLFLLDCKVGDQSGGTGQQFDWQLLDKLKSDTSFALAGGLSPANIQQARATGASILDVNSGVESAPGKKDQQQLRQLFAQLRQY